MLRDTAGAAQPPTNRPTGHQMSQQGLYVPKKAYFGAEFLFFALAAKKPFVIIRGVVNFMLVTEVKKPQKPLNLSQTILPVPLLHLPAPKRSNLLFPFLGQI